MVTLSRGHTRYALGTRAHQHKETPPHSNGAKAHTVAHTRSRAPQVPTYLTAYLRCELNRSLKRKSTGRVSLLRSDLVCLNSCSVGAAVLWVLSGRPLRGPPPAWPPLHRAAWPSAAPRGSAPTRRVPSLGCEAIAMLRARCAGWRSASTHPTASRKCGEARWTPSPVPCA